MPAAMLSRTIALAFTASLAALSLGCASLHAPLTPPSQGGAPWTEIASPHFTLYTDLEPAEGRVVLGQVEGIYTAFKDVAFPSEVDPHDHIQVVIFARERDYAALGPKMSGGYFRAQSVNDIEKVPILVMPGGLTDAARLTMQHELTHHFVNQTLGAMPPWLSEGLAQFYSTLRLEDGKFILGDPLPNLGFKVGLGWRTVQRGQWQTTLIPTGEVPSVASLVKADRTTFYQRSNNPTIEQNRAQRAFYGGAWVLVHMLNNGPEEYRKRFNAFLDRVAHHVAVRDAWEQSFGDLDPERFESDFRKYLVRPETTLQATAYTPRSGEDPDQTWKLTDAQVHLLWARLRPWDVRQSPRAKVDLDAALASDPASPEVHFLRGLFAFRQKKTGEAEQELGRALAARPEDPKYLLALASTIRGEVPINQLPPDAVTRLAALLVRLSKVAKTADALNFISWYHAEMGHPDEGLGLSERSLKADPTCWECFDTYALLLSEKGRFDDAVAAQQRAVDLMPEGLRMPEVAEQLHKYSVIARAMARRRREAESAKPAPPTLPEPPAGPAPPAP